MSFIFVSSDLEPGFCAFAQKVDREVSVVDHRDEQVACLSQQADNLAQFRNSDPVEVLLDDGCLDACQKQFLLVELSANKAEP